MFLPAFICLAGQWAVLRFLEYFIVRVRKKDTPAVLGRALADFRH